MLYQSCWNNLVTGLIVPSSLLQFVNSLFQTCPNKFGTSSANTSCEQLANRLFTTCLQVCNNLCVFTCVEGQLFRYSLVGLKNPPKKPHEGINPFKMSLIRRAEQNYILITRSQIDSLQVRLIFDLDKKIPIRT